MARLDTTGPAGDGPRTGRGLGQCKPRTDEQGTQVNEDDNSWGSGRRPRGGGRGHCFRGGRGNGGRGGGRGHGRGGRR